MRKLDISTLKEFVRLNNRRLSPTATDCSDPAVYKEFADTAHEIKELNYQINRFHSETMKGGQERFRFGDVSVVSFLLMSSPMLLAAPGIGEQIFGNQGGCAIGYFLTLAILMVRIFLQGFVSHFRVATVGHFLRIALLVICGYLHLFKQATFFGTTGIWVFIYIILGSLITLFIRSFDIKRVKEHQAEYNAFLKTIDRLDSLSSKCVQMYNKLADKSEIALENFIKANNLHIALTKRSVWFRFERNPDKKLEGNPATVDFKAPFKNGEQTSCVRKMQFDFDEWANMFIKKERKPEAKCGFPVDACDRALLSANILPENAQFHDKDLNITEGIVVNSQQFGWEPSDCATILKLVRDKKVFPYYGMEIPEFSSELKYHIFRHQYDITKFKTYHANYMFLLRVETAEERKFINDTFWEEFFVGYETFKRENIEPKWEEKIEEYESWKEGTAARLSDYNSEYIPYSHTETENLSGDEIAAVFIYTQDNTLVGAYAADNVQSLEFVGNEIKEYTDFVPNIYSQPFGYTQTQVMRRRYFS